MMSEEPLRSGTLELLRSLGFQDTKHPMDLEAVSYDFGEIQITAVALPINFYFQKCVKLEGTYNDGRHVASINQDIPFHLDDINELKALLYWAVGRYVTNAPPQWLTEGKDLQSTLKF